MADIYMDNHNQKRLWLNAACLGDSSSNGGRLNTAEEASVLIDAYRACTEWVAGWCRVDPDRVVLTTGATDACDIALTTRAGPPSVVIYSDLAHECTIRSVECAADFIGALTHRTVSVVQVTISDLFHLTPEDFAAVLIERIASTGKRPGPVVVVLEHVTSLHGWRLPVAEIARHFKSSLPRAELVVDGAQAAGLWQPPDGLECTYFGCFHKYVDGPVGTGFCVLRPGLAQTSVRRVRASQAWRTDDGTEHLPTTDIEKWRLCASALRSLSARGSVAGLQAKIRQLRGEVVNQLPEEATGQLRRVRSEYLSHIIPLDLPDAENAAGVYQFLRHNGFGTKQVGNCIRIALHDSHDVESLTRFALCACEAIRIEKFRRKQRRPLAVAAAGRL